MSTSSPRRGEDARRSDRGEDPRRSDLGRHAGGIAVGLLATPVALVAAGVGAARLAELAGTARGGTDALGLTMLAIGAVLLGALAVLGAWTPAAPLSGGLVWGLGLGLAYLVQPDGAAAAADRVAGTGGAPAVVDQLARSAASGHLAVTGVLLVGAGLAAALSGRRARRRSPRPS